MPVISFRAEQTHSIVGPSHLIPLGQARVLLTLVAALVGPVALLVLAVSYSRKYKTSRHPVLVKAGSGADTEKRPCLPKQSHKNSIGGAIMSVNKKPEVSPIAARGAFDEESLTDRRDLSRSPSSGPKRQEELGMLRADTDELQDLRARPPPPMPFTPPVPSTTLFTRRDRRLSVAASANGDFDPTLPHEANPDTYPPGSTTAMVPNVKASSPIPLRKSYTKTFPPDPPQLGSSGKVEVDDTYPAYPPSSFPSSSPIFPLAPHVALDSSEIDVTGEIVSVMDDLGSGWKRHTRVYGGGVCLACLASGGGDHGGFYGENVPLDQRR